jgi:prepilin-type N-terminal cleavage/methylation domain-containing protein
MRIKIQNSRGFTIVELMIATAVLSTILLIVTAAMIGIGNLYYKGINQARIQNASRTITGDVTQNLQTFTGLSVQTAVSSADADPVLAAKTPAWNAYCVGSTRYTFVKDVELGDRLRDQNNLNPTGVTFQHVLWRDRYTGNSCKVADLTISNPSSGRGDDPSGQEMVPPKSRVTAFSISPTTSPFNITLGLAYGDNDLMSFRDGTNTVCKGGNGEQFCSTSSISTTVLQRITSSN